ncbi:MAG: tetratricopeptide repeat protein [Sedimentisphaerales bacterium]|nr:tetratricopeptide repeat protein [Sedimentisphaerales bacterium]
MLKYTFILAALLIIGLPPAFSFPSPDVWRLDNDEKWTLISPDDKFLVAVAEVKKLVNTGQTEPARLAYEQLKKDFPELADPDLDAFIEADLLFSQGKFTKAYRAYEKIIKERPQSRLRPAILDRQYAIGTAYLGGLKKSVLRVIKLKGDPEGVRIMETITDRAGIQSALGLRASLAVVENYHKRELFNDEYDKWHDDISPQYKTGQIAKDALLGMAASKHAIYNRQPEEKRAFYDAANLLTARTNYENFVDNYPKDAERLGTSEIIEQIDEQLAEKHLVIAKYYHRTGHIQAANLYYDMVLRDYPQTDAAQAARQSRNY